MNDLHGSIDRFDEWASSYSAFYAPGSRLDLEFRFSRMLVLASRRWTALIDEAIKDRTGHSRSRWQTLFVIAFAGDRLTTLGLSERLGVQWPTLVRTLNDLEANGLILREENPADGRSRLISITEAGRQVVEDVKPVLDPVRQQVLAGFTDAEIAVTERLLDRLLTATAEVSEQSRD
jgi:MarR family transcriptional regulator, transcriptional regulator for hemolysin